MRCKNCGAGNSKALESCSKCGAKLENSKGIKDRKAEPGKKLIIILVTGVLIIAIGVIAAAYYKPIIAWTYFKMAQANQDSEGDKAIELAKKAIQFNESDSYRKFIGDVYRNKAEKLMEKDPDSALDILNKGKDYYKGDESSSTYAKIYLAKAQKAVDSDPALSISLAKQGLEYSYLKELDAVIKKAYENVGYAAKVGNEIITMPEYMFFLYDTKMQVEENFLSNAKGEAKEAFWKTKNSQGITWEQFVKDRAVEVARRFKIQLVVAKERNISLNQDEIKKFDEKLESQYERIGVKTDEEKNRIVMKKFGITLPELKEIYHGYETIKKLIDAENKKFNFLNDDLKKYYDENKKDLDKVTVRDILLMLRDSSGNPLSKELAADVKKTSETLLNRIKAGEDMISLAKKFSQDTGVEKNNGEHTFSYADSNFKEIKDWAFNAKIGDTAVVEAKNYGYYVIRLEKRTGFEDVKGKVLSIMNEKKYEELVQAWMKEDRFKLEENKKAKDSIKLADI